MFLINGQNLYTEHNRSWLISTNILTSSQLACWLSWLSSALVSQRSGVQIPNGPEFFSGLISTISSVVFLPARISYIRHPLISCASLHFRKRAGNQSKRVKLKTGSTVFRQKQTHVELMSETVRQFFFFSQKRKWLRQNLLRSHKYELIFAALYIFQAKILEYSCCLSI